MSEKKRSLLTPSQREYLRGESEPSNESQMRSRIRDRIYHTLRNDAGVLMDNLSVEDRRRIFRSWEDDDADEIRDIGVMQETYYHESMEWAERASLKIQLANLLGFLYLGIEETNLDSFEEVLESAMGRVARERNQYVTEFVFQVDFVEQATGEEIFRAIEMGEVDVDNLTITQINKVANSESTNWDDLPEEQRKKVADFFETMRSIKETYPPDE